MTDVPRESREADLAQLVTKADLAAAVAELRAEMQTLRAEMQGELRGEMQELRGELRAEIQAVKADIIKWLVPLLLGQAALIAALVWLL